MSQFTKDFEAFIREQGFNVFGFAEICNAIVAVSDAQTENISLSSCVF